MQPVKKRKLSQFTKASDILQQVCKRLGLDERFKDLELMKLWDEIAHAQGGDMLAKKTKAHRLIKGVLFIGVGSASIANELQMLKPLLEKRFFQAAEQKNLPKIKKIVFELRDI